jgi:hypothetical protein
MEGLIDKMGWWAKSFINTLEEIITPKNAIASYATTATLQEASTDSAHILLHEIKI